MRARHPSLALAALFPACLAACGGRITIMSYNVCGPLETARDGAARTLAGAAGSADGAFGKRCAVVAGAIRRAVPGGPDLVALQEVGGEAELKALRDGWLRGLGYGWYVVAGGPPSAIRVGILGRLPLRAVRSHLPAPLPSGGAQRAVLEVECSVGDSVLHVLNNHWKSRIGGTEATEPARVMAAKVVARRVERILDGDPLADVIVLGDLNEDHDEPPGPDGELAALAPWRGAEAAGAGRAVVHLVDDPGRLAGGTKPLRLYEPWFDAPREAGSYAYGEAWETPDHILLSLGLFDDRGARYRRGSFRVAAVPFLLDDRTGLPRGYGKHGATEYSDHLPIIVTLDGPRARAPRRPPPG
jgi:hypothetical protein